MSNDTTNNLNPKFTFDEIKADAEKLAGQRNELPGSIDNQKILRRKKLNQTFMDADKQPDPLWLYHEFFSEGTLNIVFGDTGIGKTFLGYQLGFDFSKKEYTIIYACLELNEKYLRKRYPTIIPNDNFIRLDFNSEYTGQKFEFKQIIDEIKECLETTTGKTILFIDNIKAISLLALNDTQVAINVMSELKRLLIQYQKAGRMVTVIVFAHIKKTDKYRCIEMNDLSGAKDVQIYLDNLISMGQSGQDTMLKYLVHLKARNGQKMPGALILKHCIDSNENHSIEEQGFDEEINHLPKRPESEIESGLNDFELNVLRTKQSEPEITDYKIGKQLGKQDTQVKRAREKLIKNGLLPQ